MLLIIYVVGFGKKMAFFSSINILYKFVRMVYLARQ